MTNNQEALANHLKNLSSFFVSNSSGFSYRSVYDFVLDRGSFWNEEPLSKEERDILQEASRGLRFEKKQCFYNSQRLIMGDSSGELQYTEGFAHCGIIPVHHGWVVLRGKVIDLTWKDQKGKSRISGSGNFLYFGVPFDRNLVLSRISETGWASSVIDDPERGWPVLKWPRLKDSVG